MESSLHTPVSSTRASYLAEVTQILLYIRDTKASGRLSLRNGERHGLAHLYFSASRLVHVTGDKRDGESVLQDLLTWSKGSVRFDSAIASRVVDVTWQQACIFERWLAFLEMRGMLLGIPASRLYGLTRSLTQMLPGKPVELPEEVIEYEPSERIEVARYWQHITGQLNTLMERVLSDEHRSQVHKLSQSAIQQVRSLVQQTSSITCGFAQRVWQGVKEEALQAEHDRAEQKRLGSMHICDAQTVQLPFSPELQQEHFLMMLVNAETMKLPPLEIPDQLVPGRRKVRPIGLRALPSSLAGIQKTETV